MMYQHLPVGVPLDKPKSVDGDLTPISNGTMYGTQTGRSRYVRLVYAEYWKNPLPVSGIWKYKYDIE